MLNKIGQTTAFLLITLTGAIVLALGVLLLFLPGPGIVVILLGVAILSKYYSWPKRILDWVREKAAGFAKIKT